MLGPPSLWTANLLISTLPAAVNAFYPYHPEYERSSNEALSPSHSPHSRRQGAASSHNLPSPVLPIRRVPVPRDNIFNILKSEDPKQGNSVAIDQDGTDVSYMVAVTFGDSKKEYHLLLDSAASNTWVMARDCPTEACKSHSLFGKEDSSSLKVQATPFHVTYGTGSVSGVVATDTVYVGPLSAPLTLGLANNVSQEFSSYPMDGILGIGRGSKAEGSIDAPSVVEILKSSALIPNTIYGVHLNRASDGAKDGELNLGGPNPERYDGDLNYLPLVPNPDGFWEIPVSAVGAGDTDSDIRGDRTAIIDTGTSFIYMPGPDADAVHRPIVRSRKSGETYAVPCDTKTLVWLQFGGQYYNISTVDYIGRDVGDGYCQSLIVGRQTFGEKQWLVGDVFLKNVYTVFDNEGGRIGFGVKRTHQEGDGDSSNAPKPSSSANPNASTGSFAPSNTAVPEGSPSAGAQRGPAGSPSPTGGAAKTPVSLGSLTVSFVIGLVAMHLY
ncbi:acid protease [Westerdykella ornata]|uniref:Acid protease n=1 Tax=Westerdykella ornata TaxID=318751 RepID=A0A6A6JXW0_WESOR|nr:acid protease [Westerdykella ornata]KAF2280576.1 acid protease [Westerdykella ornata]